jgi:AcrR family transcriptional regulator
MHHYNQVMPKVKQITEKNNHRLHTRRSYDSSSRQATAQQTRSNIITAARALFIEQGYAATTMASIAAAAGVSHETLYAAFGPKPALLHHLIEISLSGKDMPVPAPERDEVRAINSESDPQRKIEMFAHVVRQLHERVALLIDVLNYGAQTDTDLKTLADSLNDRRVGHMRLFIEHLAAANGLRAGLSIEQAADVVWLMNSPEFYLLCVRGRHWTPDYFELWLADTWKQLLLPVSAVVTGR